MPRSASNRAISLRASSAIAVSFFLDTSRSLRHGRAIERSAGLSLGDEACDAGSDFARQAGLAGHDRHEFAVEALQMRHESRLDAVPRQPDRTAFRRRRPKRVEPS